MLSSQNGQYSDRRHKPTLREIVTFKKELSLGWVITFLIGGLSNLGILIWISATLVSRVNTLELEVAALKLNHTTVSNILTQHAIDLTRQAEVDKMHNERLDFMERQQQRIADKLDVLLERSRSNGR